MTKKINITEIEDTEYKYYEPKPKDEKAFVAQHGLDKRDVPVEDGRDVFKHMKSMRKDKTRDADPAGFDKVNRGGNLGKEVAQMELPESSIDRIRKKASVVAEGTDDAAPPQPAASDNPQAGLGQIDPEPKPSSADPMGPIRSQLKNIAMAAADIYDGISEDTQMESWMTQTIAKAEGEFSKIIEGFRKKVGKTPEDKVAESFDPENPKLEGDHEGNPVYVYPVTKNKIKVNKIVTYPLVSKNLTVAKEDMSMPGNEGSATHDEPSNESSPNGRIKVKGLAFPAKPNANRDSNRESRHVPTVTPKPATKVLASPMEKETMSDDQMSRYANYIALHEAKRKGLTESDKAMRDAKRAMGPAAKETEHEPEDEPGAKERDEEGNAKGGHGAYVNDLRKVGNAGGMVKHGDGKMHEISRMEAKARYADIMSTPVAHGAREAKQKAHFNNPPKV